MTGHPTVQEIKALLPHPGSTAAEALVHVLSCEECRSRAVEILQAPSPSLHDRYLECFDRLDGELDGVIDLLDELLGPEGEQ